MVDHKPTQVEAVKNRYGETCHVKRYKFKEDEV